MMYDKYSSFEMYPERGESMPKGDPNKNTVRVDRYQKKAGYKVKSFKLKGDVADEFTKDVGKSGDWRGKPC